jgi:hypothetical protein
MKESDMLSGHEMQTDTYSVGLPDQLKPYRKPLLLCYAPTLSEGFFRSAARIGLPHAQPPCFLPLRQPR